MANEADSDFERFRRRFRLGVFAGAGALIVLPLLALLVLVATDDGENIVLTRNDVVKAASGERVWLGTMKNHTDSEYRDVAVTIRFLDRFGRPVGEVGGQAARMVPGTSFASRRRCRLRRPTCRSIRSTGAPARLAASSGPIVRGRSATFSIERNALAILSRGAPGATLTWSGVSG